jgi:hypothetical protein
MVNLGSWIRESRNVRRFLLAVAVLLGVNSLGQQNPAPAVEPGIQDNSFLVEEAYNQNFGVVQHISSFTRFWSSKDWNYSFTQEWPVPGDERHQLSYTLVALHSGDRPGSGVGIGDVLLNYRYQLVGNGDTRLAFSPRFTLILPAGDPMQGRGAGSFGVQTGLPMSVVLNKKLVSHWNVGATYFPHAQDELGDRASSAGYNLGQSFIWLVHARFNVILETVFVQSQAVVASNRTEWTNSLFLSPGIRWSHNFKNGLQIVPGIGVPLGVGPSAGERALFLYLSFEHPFRKLLKK